MTFEQALRLAGLMPHTIVPDGQWHRCPTVDKPRRRNGAYRLMADGRRGYFRNWALGELQVWEREREVEITLADRQRMAAARARDRERRIAAIKGARALWERAAPLRGQHPYLARKGLSMLGCVGLRQSADQLVVPVVRAGRIVSLQTINAQGDKRFFPGAPVKSGCHVLQRHRAPVTVLTEGLATGLAIFQSMQQVRVIVAFDAGNLLPVIQELKPTGAVVIAADNDHKTAARIGVNPGIEKARNAAQLIGAGVAFPDGIEGSDWADALKEWGDPNRIRREILRRPEYVFHDTS